MAEFTYNNAINDSTSHTRFKLNCGYHFWMLYKKKVYLCSQSKLAEELSEKLKELIVVYCENLDHARKLQKQVQNKRVKSRNSVHNKKVWLNS